MQYRRRKSILLPNGTPPNGAMVIGKFRRGSLALMVVWSCAACAQAQDAAPASQGDPKVSKKLASTAESSSNAHAIQADRPRTAFAFNHKSAHDRSACRNVPSNQAATQPANPEWQ